MSLIQTLTSKFSKTRLMEVFESAVDDYKNSSLAPEVQHTLNKWVSTTENMGVLVGGLALSFYCKPRYTSDVDVLFLHDLDVPTFISGFKKISPHNFQENKTHATVEIVTTESINLSLVIARKVISTAKSQGKFKLATGEALIAMKAEAAISNPKRKLSDSVDIQKLLLSDKVDIEIFYELFAPIMNPDAVNLVNDIIIDLRTH